MKSSGLYGPYTLSEQSITNNVTHTSPGAYALGETREGTFYISYVGRSDCDVADRLQDHVGKYEQFKYGYLDSAKAAFEKECRLYHDFEPPDNKVHPARPQNANWVCLVCTIFD